MATALTALVAFVALQHVAFGVLEAFLWETRTGRRVFGQSKEQAAATAVMAKNQGLYNGFLAAGLAWSLVADAAMAGPLRVFFLSCVVVAGLVGGLTASWRIVPVQALPAAIALALHFAAN